MNIHGIVVPHVRNALFLAKSARTLTHFIFAINVQNNYDSWLNKELLIRF